MSTSYDQMDASAPRRRSFLGVILIPLIGFIAGVAATAWLLSHWTTAASYVGIQPPPPKVVQVRVPVPVPAPTTAIPGQAAPAADPQLAMRMSRIEQQVAAINSQARTAMGSADRAEGLLVAFAARRALDRGVGLGYLENLLRQRFGDSQPQAVATIIATSHQPVTLQELQDELQQIQPDLMGGAPNRSWWQSVQDELGHLITIRKAGSQSTQPVERLTRASQRLEAGQVDVALAEVLRLPGQVNAADWVAKARRYVAARRALDTIETAALLDPRVPPMQQPPAPAGAVNPA